VVHIDYPIKQVLQKLDLAGRMIAWTVKLSEFKLRYESKRQMKAQFLANFFIKLPPHGESRDWWMLGVDKFSNKKESGARHLFQFSNV